MMRSSSILLFFCVFNSFVSSSYLQFQLLVLTCDGKIVNGCSRLLANAISDFLRTTECLFTVELMTISSPKSKHTL